jgi:hypothetical protein
MRHLTAVQPAGKTGWHFASTSSRGGHPIGYCAEHEPHATEWEARDCYAEWLRAHVHLDGQSSSWHGCQAKGCDEPTRRHAGVTSDWTHLANLCGEHLDLETAIVVMGLDMPASDSWQS